MKCTIYRYCEVVSIAKASPSPANLDEEERGILCILIALAILDTAKLLIALACILLGSSRVYGAWRARLRSASKANDHLIF
jgi:hypothetical protein